jgi:phosphohistidine phosphatase
VKRLWLLRHAKSSWDDASLPDRERPLAPRGKRAGEVIAEHVRDANIRPGVIVSSPATRARQTLELVLPGFPNDPEVVYDDAIYTFGEDAIIDRIRELPNDLESAMLVGHNPAFQEAALSLANTGKARDQVRSKFPTGALATLDLDVDAWPEVAPGCGALIEFVTPKSLRA